MRTLQGIPVNPRLPRGFFAMAHTQRPASHEPWWFRPFIQTRQGEVGPEGVRFEVYCLDGGAWDRPTARGGFGMLEEALRCALGLRAAVLEDYGTWPPLGGLED